MYEIGDDAVSKVCTETFPKSPNVFLYISKGLPLGCSAYISSKRTTAALNVSSSRTFINIVGNRSPRYTCVSYVISNSRFLSSSSHSACVGSIDFQSDFLSHPVFEYHATTAIVRDIPHQVQPG